MLAGIEVKIVVLLIMVQMHIIDDYCLQGKLASFKQKRWWEENYPDKMYRYDYLMALFLHAFSWTFMTMLPVIVYRLLLGDLPLWCYGVFVVNWLIHGVVDHFKANKLAINLITDQSIHLVQVAVTWVVLVLL